MTVTGHIRAPDSRKTTKNSFLPSLFSKQPSAGFVKSKIMPSAILTHFQDQKRFIGPSIHYWQRDPPRKAERELDFPSLKTFSFHKFISWQRRSGRQGCNPAGGSPAVSVARVGYVVMPHPGAGNQPVSSVNYFYHRWFKEKGNDRKLQGWRRYMAT